MFLWLKYIFDFNNFKLYKEKNKLSDEEKGIDHSLQKLEERFADFTRKYEEEAKLSKNNFDIQIENLRKITEIHNKNIKEKLVDEVKTLKDLSSSQSTTLKSKFEDELKNLKELSKDQNLTLKSKFEDEVKILKELDQKNEKFLNENKNLSLEIKNIFSNNKLRGNIGETLFENILNNYLGPQNNGTISIWRKQYSFKNGNIVDFAINHPNIKKWIPVDSKFPLNKIEKYWNDQKISSFEMKQIEDELKSMIKDISKKYVVNNPETTDFALLFVPSESVYNFLVSEMVDIFEYGNKRNVYLCSPTNILAILSTYILATEKLTLYEELNPIVKLVEEIKEEYSRLYERWNLQIKDFDKLKNNINKLDITFNKINRKSEKITSRIDKVSPDTVIPETKELKKD